MSTNHEGSPLARRSHGERDAIPAQLSIDLGDEAPRAPAALTPVIPPVASGARLRLARRGRGLSQRALGRLLRRSVWTVARWERSSVPARHVHAVARALGVSRRWLASGIEPARVPRDGTLPPGLAWEERLELAAEPGTRHGVLIDLSCDEAPGVRKAARETLRRLGLWLDRHRGSGRPRRRRPRHASGARRRPARGVSRPNASGSHAATAQAATLVERERRLRARVREERTLEAAWDLLRFYREVGREDLVRLYLRQLLGSETDLDVRAYFHVNLGVSYERARDWKAAVEEYRQAVALEPVEAFTAYFAHNNLAYCLNTLGEHEEAERLCRVAIAVDPARPNAYKNLGVSLEGLGEYAEAAEAWVYATRVDPGDPRALRLLEELIASRPELLIDVPGLEQELDECRRAVRVAGRNSRTA